MGLLWSVYLVSSLLALDSQIPPLGIWVIAAFVGVIQSAAALAEHEAERPTQAMSPHVPYMESLRVWLGRSCCVSILLSIAACVFFVRSSLDLFDLPLNFLSLLRIGGLWTMQRYNFMTDPWPLRIAAIWPYPPALLGGILWGLAVRRFDKAVALVALLPSLLISLLLGGRIGFVLGLALWLGGSWTTERARTGARRRLVNASTLTVAVGLAAGLLFFFIFMFGFRSLADPQNDVVLVANGGQIRNYIFGSPAAFAHWLDNSERGPLGWGGLSFPGIFDVTGLRPRTIGTYLDHANTTAMESTNIFTMFRGLIEDFSFPGAFLICGVWGFLSGWAYSKPSFRCVLVSSAFYAVALFSPLYNVLGFNSSIFAFVVAWLVLKYGTRRAAALPSKQSLIRT
jgi:oligosaccharide repeat unit polymerase